MSTTKPTLVNRVSEGKYHLIRWDQVTQQELKDGLKLYPNLLEDLVLNEKWMGMTANLFKFALVQNSLIGEDKLVHFATKKGKFNNIPKELVNHELLSLKGTGNKSVYHLLARNQEINLIDEGLLTKEVLILKDDTNSTPLHAIASYDSNLIFKREIDIDDLFMQNDIGETPLYNWASGVEWYKIPDKFLTKETLAQSDDGPVAILDVIVQQHKYDLATNTKRNTNHCLEKTFKKIDNKELKRLTGDKEKTISNIAKKELTRRFVTAEMKQNASIDV